jgi:uncharacterized damage-inducible protein DinB
VQSERLAAIRHELVDAQSRLLDTLERVGLNEGGRESPNEPGWTVRDLLAHVATSEVGFLPTLRRMAQGGGGVPQDFDRNRWNAGQLRRQSDTPTPELVDRLKTAHQEMLDFLDTLEEQALDQRGWLTIGRDGTLEDALRVVASHKRTHADDMRAALAAGAR